MKVRIGVISDTHLRRVTEGFKDLFERRLSDVDMILHAGDLVSAEVIDFFEGKNFYGVHGNMDPPEVRTRLPERQVVEVGPYRIGLVHGWGPPGGLEARISARFSDVDVLVYGHSHEPANHVEGGLFFFNPGAAMGYSANGVHTIGILEIDDTIHGEIVQL